MERDSNYGHLEEEKVYIGEHVFYMQRQGGILQSHPSSLLCLLQQLVFSLFGVVWVLHTSVQTTLLSWHSHPIGKRRTKAWNVAPLCLISLRNSALLGKWLWRYPREGSALWHQVILSIYGSHSNGWDANTVVRWSHRCPWKAIAQVFQDFSKFTRFMVGDGDRIRFWEDLWWGDQSLGVHFPRLLRVVMDKNIPISSILGSTRPFSWNFNFRRNLSDSEIEELESLMQSLDHLHLSPSVPDKRSWSLSSSGLFTVKSFFLALSQISGLPSVFLIKLVWNSQVPFKSSPLSGWWLTRRLFQLTKIDWVPPRSVFDMISINFNGFGSSKRGIVLWQAACIAILWVVWRERNARIFEDKSRNSENLWDMIHFLASLWVSCSKVFKGIPLNVIHLDWLAACNSIGLA
ncbi:hypothetical protein CK203_091968 [Vitis vinifera]|uniref:Uncharacterized protein n=1 Tax=Vitis vinifera TaxID=29760 RepID=A0A438DEV1_VITVI|nr:hypothetical protein CK203_091968 [Vitis vinifera]